MKDTLRGVEEVREKVHESLILGPSLFLETGYFRRKNLFIREPQRLS